MDKHQQKIDFDREIEREDIFVEIKKLRNQIKYLNSKIVEGNIEKVSEVASDIEKDLDIFKEQQMTVFEDMLADSERLQAEIDIFNGKIKHYDNLNKNQKNAINPSASNNMGFKNAKNLGEVEEEPELEEDEEINYYDKDQDSDKDQNEENNQNTNEDQEENNNDEEQDEHDQSNDNINEDGEEIMQDLQNGNGNDLDDDSVDNIIQNDMKNGNENSDKQSNFASQKDLQQIQSLEKQIEQIDNKMKLNKEKVEEIDKKIKANGGINCGWKKEDQNDFIKLKNKHKGQLLKPAFMKEYKASMAYIQEDELNIHLEKYLQYCEYEEEKKVLMQQYKDLKEEKTDRTTEITTINAQIAKEKFFYKEKVIKEEERKRAKEELKKWKEKKTDYKEEEETKELIEHVSKRKERDKKEKERQDQLKKQVQEYKELKEQEKIKDRSRQEQDSKPAKRQVSLEAKQRIQQKEELLMKKKQQQILQIQIKKEQEEIKKLQLLEAKSNKYTNVDSKLGEKTIATQAHERQKFSEKVDRFSDKSLNLAGGVKNFGKGIPLWRQGAQ